MMGSGGKIFGFGLILWAGVLVLTFFTLSLRNDFLKLQHDLGIVRENHTYLRDQERVLLTEEEFHSKPDELEQIARTELKMKTWQEITSATSDKLLIVDSDL